MSSIFLRFLTVMDISVRHDIFYNFSSGVINVKNKEKNLFFLLPIFIRFLFHALWRPSIYAPSFVPNERPCRDHNSWRHSFGSNFTEVRVAIILNLFWIFFHGILLQILSNLYKSFSSDVIKSGQKNDFLILRTFRFILSWRYLIVRSFIS